MQFAYENGRKNTFKMTSFSAAAITGVVANYYNIAQMSWGATALELSDPVRYPTLSRIIGSAFK